jgi:hypothetical protein
MSLNKYFLAMYVIRTGDRLPVRQLIASEERAVYFHSACMAGGDYYYMGERG